MKQKKQSCIIELFTASIIIAIVLTVSIDLGGCSAKKRIDNVPQTFLEDVNINTKIKNLPFDHSWVLESVDRNSVNAVYFKPIRTDLLPDDSWAKSASLTITSKEGYQEKAKELAEYFRGQLVDKTGQAPQRRFQVVNEPGPGVLVVEIAFTELEFSHPIARAGALVSPIPGTGPALSTISDPHVAFAARFVDGNNGQLVATAADRKFSPLRIIDLNKLTVMSAPREICSLWAESIAEVLDKGRFTEIKEKRFSFLLW